MKDAVIINKIKICIEFQNMEKLLSESFYLPNMLMIGGATRNVGKTTFVCKVIEKFSQLLPIVAIKVKTIYEGDSFFHGKDKNPLTENYRIINEVDATTEEDTALMLKAGAQKVFRVKVKSNFIEQVFKELQDILPKNIVWICESNSLRLAVKPSLFIMITNQLNNNMKPSAEQLLPFADLIVVSDGKTFNFSENNLTYSETYGWKFV